MKNKAKLFSPDMIKTQICQAVSRDIPLPTSVRSIWDDPLVMLRSRLLTEMDKKYTSIKRNDELRASAIAKFAGTNAHMSQFGKEGLNLPPQGLTKPQSRFSPRHNILLRARAILHFVLTPFSEDEWFSCCKHGTGSSIGVPFVDTSLEAKSTLPMTCTSRVTHLLDRYREFDRRLNSAIIFYNDGSPFGEWYGIVEGSRATTVPKNNLTDRMIAVEPTGNMFFQQGLMTMMYHRMKAVGLDIETLPTVHKERARFASITSKEATIDWSSASDCVSIELLRWLIPPMWFMCCDQVRSPSISIDGDMVELNMFSTMGNAVTFPLETLVFWSLAHAVRLQHRNTLSHFPEWEDRHLCTVFGDDCIVPSDIASSFIKTMTSVGFIINEEKSFYDDKGFRESCGGDYLRGYDVRPYFLKAPTSDRLSALEPWLYIIGNRLIAKYMMCFGTRNYIYQTELFETLFGIFAKHNLKVKIVPNDYPDDAGLKIAFDLERFVANYRFELSPIKRSQHGLYSFLFCKFNYKHKEKKFDELHYCTWLKSPSTAPRIHETMYALKRVSKRHVFSLGPIVERQLDPDESSPFRSKKDNGGYVVARGHTAHWAVPNVNDVKRPH